MTTPVLETRNLTRRFGGLTAVDNLSLTLPGGKLHAIIGPNGAGKTTLFNLISGLLRPDAGQVLFRGRDITGLPAHEISRLGIKRTLQVKSVFVQLTVAENLWITFEGSNRFLHPLRDAESDPRRTRAGRADSRADRADGTCAATGGHLVVWRCGAARDRDGAHLRSATVATR